MLHPIDSVIRALPHQGGARRNRVGCIAPRAYDRRGLEDPAEMDSLAVPAAFGHHRFDPLRRSVRQRSLLPYRAVHRGSLIVLEPLRQKPPFAPKATSIARVTPQATGYVTFAGTPGSE